MLAQKKDDKNKIYSLHALEVACIAKGKVHKKYEFGSKVSLSTTQKSAGRVAAVNFRGNPNDNKTLERTLDQQERMTGVRAKNAFVDRGYKSREIALHRSSLRATERERQNTRRANYENASADEPPSSRSSDTQNQTSAWIETTSKANPATG